MTIARAALAQALRAFGRLFVTVAPVYAAVVVLKHTPVLTWIAAHMAPAMGAFGLPGHAALVLVLGASINLYAAVAACAGLALTAGQVTTLALMGGFAHNLFVEGAVLARLSRRAWLWMTIRVLIAIAAGLALGPVFARAWPASSAALTGTGATAAPGLAYDLLVNGARSIALLFAIVVPIVFVLEVLQRVGALARLRRPLRPALTALGLDERASEALIAGVFFGLVYGAGVILNRVQEEGLDEDQIGRLCLTFVLCHAIVEDTLLFVPVGASAWPVVLVRVAAAGAGLLVLRALPAHRPAITAA